MEQRKKRKKPKTENPFAPTTPRKFPTVWRSPSFKPRRRLNVRASKSLPRDFLSEDLRAQSSSRELHINLGANSHLFGGTHHIAGGVRADGIAALQDAQWAAFFELQLQAF